MLLAAVRTSYLLLCPMAEFFFFVVPACSFFYFLIVFHNAPLGSTVALTASSCIPVRLQPFCRHARSRRRASARHGEAPLAHIYDIVAPVLSAFLIGFQAYCFALFVLARDRVHLTGRNCPIVVSDPNCVGGGLGRACTVF